MQTENDTKKCNRCGEIKTADQFYTFYRDKAKERAYLRPDCKTCFNRMAIRGKARKRADELLKGKPGQVTKRKAAYRYNRDQILRNAKRQAHKIPKKVSSALVEGELSEYIKETKVGRDKDQKPKKKRQRRSSRAVRSSDGGSKSDDSGVSVSKQPQRRLGKLPKPEI